MKKIIFNSIIILYSITTNAQNLSPAPLSFLDSLFTAAKDDNYEKYKRQLISSYAESEQSFIEFNQLKNTIKKYNLSFEELHSSSFKYMSGLDNQKKRVLSVEGLFFYFLKDSVIISLRPESIFLFENNLKFIRGRSLEINTYPIQGIYFNKTPSQYFIKSIPVNFVKFGNEIYRLIKNNDIEKLIEKYTTEKDFEKIFTLDKFKEIKIKGSLKEINRNIKRLKKDNDIFKIITGYNKDKVRVYWKKKNT